MTRRTAARLGTVLMLLLALTVLSAPLGRASCAGPQIGFDAVPAEPGLAPSPTPRPASPGDRVVVVGWFLTPDCNDTVQMSGGCSARPQGPELERPATGVRLLLTQGARTWQLAAGDADAALTIRFTVTLPDDLAAGAAELRLSYQDERGGTFSTQPLPLRVR